MLYHICYQYLSGTYTWLNVFKYITFRAMSAFLFTFLVVLVIEPLFIRALHRRGVKGQPIRDDGPSDHGTKQGTPTMGGIVIIGAVTLSTILFCDLSSPYVWITLFVALGCTSLGFVDDWRKITKQDSSGVSERTKLLTQGAVGCTAGATLYFLGFPTDLLVPVLKDVALPLGLLFIPFVALVITATSNAVNLTDGLDGLAIVPVMTVAALFGVIVYAVGHSEVARYLHLPYIANIGEVVILLASVIAGGLGFLWYNTFPAQVFMGDTGALALGGILGIVAILGKQEVLLIIAGGIFVIEALSVLVQRYYYKLTKKRVFKMAPIHHHFELIGWAEPKIIVRAWILSIILALIALTTLKVR